MRTEDLLERVERRISVPWPERRDGAGPARRERPRWWTPVLVALAVVVLAGAALVAGASAVVSPFGPLALAGALVLVVATWWRPVIGSVAVAAVAPALAGVARGVGLPGLKLSELLVIAVAVVLFFRRPGRWRDVSRADLAVAAFAAAALALNLAHLYKQHIEADEVFFVGLQPVFLFLTWWAASRGVETRRDVDVVLRWVLLVSVVPAGLAVMQYFDVPGVRDLLRTLTGGGGLLAEAGGASSPRVTGPFTIWHSLGGYLLLPAVIAAVELLRGGTGRRRILPAWLLAGVLVIDLSAEVLAITITLLLWLPIAVLVAAALSRRFLRALGLVLVLAAAAYLTFPTVIQDRITSQSAQTEVTSTVEIPAGSFLPQALGDVLPQTVQYRILVWERDYLPVVSRVAFVGIGTDEPPGVLFGSTENQALTYLLRGGLGLLGGAALAIGALGVRAFRHARAPGGGSRSGALALAGVIAFFPAACMVWPYLSNAGLSYALFGIAGAALAVEPRRQARATVRAVRGAAAPVRPALVGTDA